MATVGLFVVAFVIPIFFAFKFVSSDRRKGLGVPASTDLQLELNGQDSSGLKRGRDKLRAALMEQLFPAPVSLVGGERMIRFTDAEGSSSSFDPSPGRDLLIGVWFALPRQVKNGERMPLFSKISREEGEPHGYALSLVGEPEGTRVQAFWKTAEGVGRWFSFAELKIIPGAWNLLVLSFREGRYLGVHSSFKLPGVEKPEISLLGGYDLASLDRAAAELPAEGADRRYLATSLGELTLGSSGKSRFRGIVGGVILVKARDLTGSIRDLLKELTRNPLEFPASIRDQECKLWYGFSSEPGADIGKAVIVTIGDDGARALNKSQ